MYPPTPVTAQFLRCRAIDQDPPGRQRCERSFRHRLVLVLVLVLALRIGLEAFACRAPREAGTDVSRHALLEADRVIEREGTAFPPPKSSTSLLRERRL